MLGFLQEPGGQIMSDLSQVPVTFLGAGLMGKPMILRLLQAGYRVTAYNRTAARLAEVAEAGAHTAPDPMAAVGAGRAIIVMLADGPAIGAVLNDQVMEALRGRTVIQMSTIGPEESRRLAARVEEHGGEYLEAPVLGSVPEVRLGELMLFIGGTPACFEHWRPLLLAFGPAPRLVGPVGSAAALKLAFNQLIVALTSAFSFSLGVVLREGIDPQPFMELLRQSALYAPTFDKKLDRMLDRQFENPNFPLRLMLKDAKLAIAEGERLGLNASAVRGAGQLLQLAMQSGLGEKDYSALYEVVNRAGG
jgi:3-hydroxyisobutyrate dehydrogenase